MQMHLTPEDLTKEHLEQGTITSPCKPLHTTPPRQTPTPHIMGETRNSSQSGDHHQPVNIAATTTASDGGDPQERELQLSTPVPEALGGPSRDLSTAEILPITSPSVSQSITVDAPNVASTTVEPRPAESHETIPQGAGEAERELPQNPFTCPAR